LFHVTLSVFHLSKAIHLKPATCVLTDMVMAHLGDEVLMVTMCLGSDYWCFMSAGQRG